MPKETEEKIKLPMKIEFSLDNGSASFLEISNTIEFSKDSVVTAEELAELSRMIAAIKNL